MLRFFRKFRKPLILKNRTTSLILLIHGIIMLSSCERKNEIQQNKAGTDWPVYLGDNSSSQYSPLNQINRQNVHLLEPVWEYHSENGNPGKRTQIQCNPIIIDEILYGTSPKLKVFALKAGSGEKIWEFNFNEKINFAMNVNRGVTYWSDGFDKRIFFTAGPNLYALDAKNGELISSFGENGIVSLKEGLGENTEDKYVVATTPGILYEDILIIGSRVSENANAAPGFIRAYNVKTGKLVWLFKTIPDPGEFGYATWPGGDMSKIGGANSWSGMSLDAERGIVYIPTGSASFDFWGGNRKGENLFANCILALDAASGKRIWHFQTVHHDLWDRDLPAPPNLVRVNHNGENIDAVAQITKSGFVFLLDRETGEPLFPVEELPVPSSDLKGEETWPTQPFPVSPPPFSPQALTLENITDISPESNNFIASILKNVRTGKQFIPPSKDGTVIFPGFDGGGEWGGAAFDTESSVLYVNSNIMPWILTMVEIDSDNKSNAHPGERIYRINCAMCHGQNREGKPESSYPSLTNLQIGEPEVLALFNSGKGFMPSYAHLKKEEKEMLVSYLLEITNTDAHSQDINNNKANLPYTHTGYNRFLDPEGFPAIKPPWGMLSAIDLNKGEIKWQVPLGEFTELSDRGIPKTGTENYGGPVVTAGGLIFIAASKDEYFRAFDKNTGEELWKYKLPAGGYATPSVYQVNGQQFVVIACGGGKMGTSSGDSYLAFALKKRK
jgi:quinoprotein glucose dehydrogenase